MIINNQNSNIDNMEIKILKSVIEEKPIKIESTINIYNGDCLEIMNNIADNSIDMILCDLPYGCTKNKWDTIIPFEKLWKHYNRIIKKMVLLYYLVRNHLPVN